jgi:hypothetical protein
LRAPTRALPALRPRVRAFNAPTPQDAHHDSDTPGNHAPVLFCQLPRGNPSPPLCSTVRQGRCQLCDCAAYPRTDNTSRPRRGPTAPSNVFSVLTQGHAVTSGRRDRSSPSLSALCDHPRHCSTTLGTVATSRRCWDARGQDVANSDHCATYGPPSTAPSNQPTTAASQPTATPPPSKPLLYENRTHHDASTGAGFARTAVSSAALLAIPPHVGK